MGRPATIDDDEVLEIAREVFLAKGINASTAEVARRAGISQASIFKHFKNKHRLFLSALHQERDRQDWLGLFQRRLEQAGPREALFTVGVKAITFGRQFLPLALVSWSSRHSYGIPGGPDFEKGPARGIHTLVGLLRREMAQGRIRKTDPWVVARTFMGAMQGYVLMTVVFKVRLGPDWDTESYVRRVVDLLWEGLEPKRRRKR
jgi:AcrR family transcriptional regulator